MVVVSAVALSEKVPDPSAAPALVHAARGRAAGPRGVRRRAGRGRVRARRSGVERGQFALRGGLLDVFPATEDRAVRVDMFDVEIESLRWFSTFTQRSLGDVDRGRDRARGGARARASRAGGDRRLRRGVPTVPDIAELLPVERFGALLDLLDGHDRAVVAAEEELAPALADHWSDVCAAFADADAHHLYVSPEEIEVGAAPRARGSGCRRSPAISRCSCARRPPTPPRARWPRPSPSWRSSCARAIARSSRSRAAARASAPPTTSGA